MKKVPDDMSGSDYTHIELLVTYLNQQDSITREILIPSCCQWTDDCWRFIDKYDLSRSDNGDRIDDCQKKVSEIVLPVYPKDCVTCVLVRSSRM